MTTRTLQKRVTDLEQRPALDPWAREHTREQWDALDRLLCAAVALHDGLPAEIGAAVTLDGVLERLADTLGAAYRLETGGGSGPALPRPLDLMSPPGGPPPCRDNGDLASRPGSLGETPPPLTGQDAAAGSLASSRPATPSRGA